MIANGASLYLLLTPEDLKLTWLELPNLANHGELLEEVGGWAVSLLFPLNRKEKKRKQIRQHKEKMKDTESFHCGLYRNTWIPKLSSIDALFQMKCKDIGRSHTISLNSNLYLKLCMKETRQIHKSFGFPRHRQ